MPHGAYSGVSPHHIEDIEYISRLLTGWNNYRIKDRNLADLLVKQHMKLTSKIFNQCREREQL